ncbi:hypothetical protein MTR_4g025650 [Medicago truncatula]|uniref:Uncharacterized protein n=1 Tax=Medicago truncatula TaxID=3880 RepID=A0A072UH82_MEDTR|nr:hypothetical protein MTR_4g025650 [Medicago truncatula]
MCNNLSFLTFWECNKLFCELTKVVVWLLREVETREKIHEKDCKMIDKWEIRHQDGAWNDSISYEKETTMKTLVDDGGARNINKIILLEN